MKKLILLGISLALIPITMHADIKITLTKNFLAIDGTYKFIVDLKGKIIDKAWDVIIKDGKASIDVPKGIKGRKISIKDNVITIDAKKLAADLEIIGEAGPFRWTSATMGQEKESKNFVIDVGPGLALGFVSSKKDEKPTYKVVVNPNIPTGSYTLKLLIPHDKDKIYKFNIKEGKLDKLLAGSDKTGKADGNWLQIGASAMCKELKKKHRAKIAGIAAGIAIPVIIGTAVAGGAFLYSSLKGQTLSKLPDLINKATAAAAKAGRELDDVYKFAVSDLGITELDDIVQVSGMIEATTKWTAAGATVESLQAAQQSAKTAAQVANIVAGAAAGIGAGTAVGAAVGIEAIESISKKKDHLGWREATLQVICDSGALKGDAVKIDYEQCRNNELLLNLAKQKLIITGTR